MKMKKILIKTYLMFFPVVTLAVGIYINTFDNISGYILIAVLFGGYMHGRLT